jgi:hypothetical protein
LFRQRRRGIVSFPSSKYRIEDFHDVSIKYRTMLAE